VRAVFPALAVAAETQPAFMHEPVGCNVWPGASRDIFAAASRRSSE